jgi:molybdopterin-guanine dinucleotide biosynthesis protein A
MDKALFRAGLPVGIVLAGGRSRRLGGGDKGLLPLAGRPILAHVIARAAPQVAALALSANGDPARFAGFGLKVVADGVAGFAGPLAGVLAGLDWAAAEHKAATHLASFAGDAPFLPRDLVARLAAALDDGHEIACAAAAGRLHPVFALWPVALREALREAVTVEGVRKVELWLRRFRLAVVEFPPAPVDAFFNVNRPEDLAAAERLAAPAAAG